MTRTKLALAKPLSDSDDGIERQSSVRRIYLDYNATTPICDDAAVAMNQVIDRRFGNPNSVHKEGQDTRNWVEEARDDVAELVDVSTRELVFTSGATESINWVHHGCARPGAIVISNVEHSAVIGAAEHAAKTQRRTLIRAEVDGLGRLDLDQFDAILRDNEVALVSVMLVNNEVGNRFPIASIAEICSEHGALLHTDATQAVGRIPVSLRDLQVDFASFSAHKLYGPKGVGALYIRGGLQLEALLTGGHQERGRRAGTENVIGIVGFGAAARAAVNLRVEAARQAKLRARLHRRLVDNLELVVNTDLALAAPNTLNISFIGCNAEELLIALDLVGVAVSAGSACSSGSLEPSHVLLALTDDPKRQRSAIRFSLGRQTREWDIEDAAERIVQCVRTVK